MSVVKQWLSLVLLLLCCTGVRAQPVALSVYNNGEYALTDYLLFYEDKDNSLRVDQLHDPQTNDRFQPLSNRFLTFGLTQSTLWFKLKLRYPTGAPNFVSVKTFYYEVARAHLDIAELHILRPEGRIETITSDVRKPLSEKPIVHVNSVFPFDIALGEEITLYLKVQNRTGTFLPQTLWTPEAFSTKISHEEYIYGIFYGGMLIMIVYNLFLFVSIREPSYIYYSGYLISALVFEAIDMGHGAAWIDDGLTWFNKEYVPIAIWCTWLTAFLFTRHFLEIPTRHPLLNKFLTPLFLFSLICAAFSFFVPFKQSLIVSVYFCGYAVATMPIVGAYVWYKGNKNASYFTLAWLFNVAGFITYSSVATGRAPATPLFVASMPLGTLLEAVMLSFALAERIKRTQKDALTANRLSMQHLASYRSLFDNALEGIYQVTLRGRLINANPAMARILGFSSVNALLRSGKRTVASIFEDPARQWRELLRGKSIRSEIHRTRLNGEMYIAIHTAQLVRNTYGQPAYIEGTLVNITERYQREQAERERLRERREKATAEAMTQAKSQFLKNMSFEIRSSLAPIIGFSEALKEPTLPAETKRNAAHIIVANAQTLLQLVNDILDYSKIEAGKMPIEQIEIDLLALLASVKAQFATQAQAKSLQFEVQHEWPLPPRIFSDPTRLKQILQNLCSNAIKYTYQGRVTLRVYWDAGAQQLCFAVHDTGPGLSPQDLRLLQDANPATTTTDALQRGGLGVAITRQLARLLGGNLKVESTPGQGSTFSVSIGCRTAAREDWVSADNSAQRKPAATLAVPALEGRVLLAEDNVVNQKLIARIIGKTGAEVIVVGDGEQARNAALQQGFDLILMDVNMPVMGGLDATRSLRDKGYAGPIYALTAEHGLEEIRASMEAGCDGHLTKPVEVATFYAVMAQCLREKGCVE